MEAAFAAVCIDVKFLQTKLSAQHDDSPSVSPSAEETLDHLCQQCDSSLQFLQSLCQQKVFRECVVKNKVFLGFFSFHLIIDFIALKHDNYFMMSIVQKTCWPQESFSWNFFVHLNLHLSGC